MSRKYLLGGDAVNDVLPALDALREVPQVKVNQDTADISISTILLFTRRANPRNLITNSLNSQNARSTHADFFPTTRREQCLVPKFFDELCGIDEYTEVVQNLRDAIVREHRQFVHALRKERVWLGIFDWVKRRPCFCNEDLGPFPEVHCQEV